MLHLLPTPPKNLMKRLDRGLGREIRGWLEMHLCPKMHPKNKSCTLRKERDATALGQSS